MGEPRRVHDAGGLSRWTHLFLSLSGLALGLGVFLYALAIESRQFPNPAQPVLAVLFIFSILCFLAGSVAFRRIRRHWGSSAVVYADGLAYDDGDKILVFRWNEVAAIYTQKNESRFFEFVSPDTCTYTIVHENGRSLKLDGRLQWIDELYEEVRGHVYHPILARCCAAYDSGETVKFGPLALNKNLGLVAGDKNYAWHEIARLAPEDDRLYIKTKGKWSTGYSAPLAAIPNVDVLMAMVNELAGLTTAG